MDILDDVDLVQLIKDVELNESLITHSVSDKIELIFDYSSFKLLNKIILDEIYKMHPFDEKVYIKKIFSQYQQYNELDNIHFEKNINSSTKVLSEYSFILPLSGDELIINLNKKIYNIKTGNIIIFNTVPFLENKSKMNRRLILFGSYSLNLFDNKIKKEFI